VPYRQQQQQQKQRENESFSYVENSIMVYTTSATLHHHYELEKPGYQGYSNFNTNSLNFCSF
jgi:hypothetical protein